MATDETIEQMLARGDYPAAAARAAAEGDLPRAVRLYERVWSFADAVPLALRMNDLPLAIRLALEARDLVRATEIAGSIPGDDRPALIRAAETFAGRGHHAEAAALNERAGRWQEAATLYRRAGALLKAATMLERAERWQEAGRLYEEAAAAGEPDGAETAAAQLALGRLLAGLGRPLEATRALQAAARHALTRVTARRRLCATLLSLGLPHAALEIARRLHRDDPSIPADAVAIAAADRDGAPIAAASVSETASGVPRRFRVLHALGAGALGRVYAAEDELLGRTVALKVLSVGGGAAGPEREAFLRFLREAEAIGRLRHPNIVMLHELDEAAGLMVIEHLPGGTLAEALVRGGPLAPASARRLALDLLAGLAAAHRSGVVHRDVKPANIFFDGAGNAKLGDFGAAHLLDFGHTQTGSFVGTLAYLSPEQITGSGIGFPADLYGLGATLYEALTGRPPFLGPDFVAQHLSETPAPPTALRPELTAKHDRVLMRALAKAPDDRYPSAAAMAEAIEEWPAVHSGQSAGVDNRLKTPLADEPVVRSGGESPASRAQPLGRTTRGRLVLVTDARVGREVLVEELDQPLAEESLAQLQRWAAAGGPRVQRILQLDVSGTRVTYERLVGEECTLAALAPAEAALLIDAWRTLILPPTPRHRVARTAGGPVIVLSPEVLREGRAGAPI